MRDWDLVLEQFVLAAAQNLLRVGDDLRCEVAQAQIAQRRLVEPDHRLTPRGRAADDGRQRHRFARVD